MEINGKKKKKSNGTNKDPLSVNVRIKVKMTSNATNLFDRIIVKIKPSKISNR
jgi:hypothetical protein